MSNAEHIQSLAQDLEEVIDEHDIDLEESCLAVLMVLTAIMFQAGRKEDLAHRMLSVTWKAAETFGRLH